MTSARTEGSDLPANLRDPVQLKEALASSFNIAELHALCFEVGIPYEDLAGEGRSAKALSLVEHAQRHGIYKRLVSAVIHARPRKKFRH